MEHLVHLGTRNYRIPLSQRLEELRMAELLPLSIHEKKEGNRWLIECHFVPNPEETNPQEEPTARKIFQYYLANVVADTILSTWEKEHIRRLLKRKYKLTNKECEDVLQKVVLRLSERDRTVQSFSRKSSLVSQIVHCLDDHAIFDIEGFLNFRGQEYKSIIQKAVEYAVDEYVLEREYKEFIQLLKTFLDTQTPQMETLHVVISATGRFSLYDEKGMNVTETYLTDYHPDDLAQDVSYDDLLISALIIVAPRHIVMHVKNEDSKKTLQSIDQVFENRLSYCAGCALCEA